MLIRKTKLTELDRVMDIYEKGRAYMRQNGNTLQWTNGYPPKELIVKDIENGVSHVVTDENDVPLCVFAFLPGPDPTYLNIYNGEWKNTEPYYVIHRIASENSRKGVASFVFTECMKRADNLRIDTHRDNIPMQRCLLKNGFTYCGIIYLENGDERLAYQKVKDNKKG